MTLAPYQGMNLVPGVGTEVFSAEHDVSDIVYGPLTNCLYLINCLWLPFPRESFPIQPCIHRRRWQSSHEIY